MESALLHAASAAETQSLSFLDIALWVVLPYVSFAILIVGLAWRYKTDQYGWTSRSSQWNEPTILRWASPLFHFGVLFVFMGHILGLVIPKTWTEAAGVPQHVYHLMATIPGTIAGIMTIVGLALLIYRRLVYKSVRVATTRMDIVTYVMLTIPVLLGGAATLLNQVLGGHEGYDYRETISGLVPVDLLPAPAGAPDGRRAPQLQAAHRRWSAALLHLAVHPPRARGERAGRLRGASPGGLPRRATSVARTRSRAAVCRTDRWPCPPQSLAAAARLWRGDRQGRGRAQARPRVFIVVPAFSPV